MKKSVEFNIPYPPNDYGNEIHFGTCSLEIAFELQNISSKQFTVS